MPSEADDVGQGHGEVPVADETGAAGVPVVPARVLPKLQRSSFRSARVCEPLPSAQRARQLHDASLDREICSNQSAALPERVSFEIARFQGGRLLAKGHRLHGQEAGEGHRPRGQRRWSRGVSVVRDGSKEWNN